MLKYNVSAEKVLCPKISVSSSFHLYPRELKYLFEHLLYPVAVYQAYNKLDGWPSFWQGI